MLHHLLLQFIEFVEWSLHKLPDIIHIFILLRFFLLLISLKSIKVYFQVIYCVESLLHAFFGIALGFTGELSESLDKFLLSRDFGVILYFPELFPLSPRILLHFLSFGLKEHDPAYLLNEEFYCINCWLWLYLVQGL
jgi:hypothetical protein